MEAVGNRLTDEAAKGSSLEERITLFSLIPSIPKVTLRPQFTKEKEKKLDKIGATKTGDKTQVFPDGREMISP
jgi:hypothetical protein